MGWVGVGLGISELRPHCSVGLKIPSPLAIRSRCQLLLQHEFHTVPTASLWQKGSCEFEVAQAQH